MFDSVNKTLKFNPNGKFRILMLSDFHCGKHFDPRTKDGIEALVSHTQPDFVMLGGDQCLGYSPDHLRQSLADILEPIEKRNIPWAHVFGREDHHLPMSVNEQEAIYESFHLCLSKTGPAGLQGICNYSLPVLASGSDEIAYNLFALDSNRDCKQYAQEFQIPPELNNMILPENFGSGKNDSMPFFSQVRWYYRTSKAMEAEAGHKIPAVLFTHNPIPEHNLVHMNPEECRMVGHMREWINTSELNSGLFFACLQRGDVRGIFAGHQHQNTFQGTYCGILLACSGSISYDTETDDDLRGGRIIDLDEKTGRMESKYIPLMEIMGGAAIKNPDNFKGGLKYFMRNSHMFDQAVPLKAKVYVKK